MNLKNLEWARPATPKEIDDFKKFFQKQKENSLLSEQWVIQNSEMILRHHSEFIDGETSVLYQAYKSGIDEETKQLENGYKVGLEIIENPRTVRCKCGKGTLYVRQWREGDFIACTAWKRDDNIQHGGYNYNTALDGTYELRLKGMKERRSYDYFKHHYYIGKNYITKLRQHFDYPKFVKTSDVFHVLSNNNVEFAHPEITSEYYYKVPKLDSKKQEAIIRGTLESIFEGNVKYQLHIRYQLKSEKHPKSCFPDYICFDMKKKLIYVYDAKLNIGSVTNDKLFLYKACVQKMVEGKGFKVIAKYIFKQVEDHQDAIKSNGLTLQMLKDGEL